MSIKVIGAGFGRTGTLSLKAALEQLGFNKCYHMMEVTQNPPHREIWLAAHRGEVVDWDALFDGYAASVDWPSCNLWQEQLAHYPDAKVILSLRDPEAWYKSVMNTIYPSSKAAKESEDPAMQAHGQWAFEIVWDRVFDGRMDDKEHVINVFNNHNQSVIDQLHEDKLLVFDAKMGWDPLCEFLEVPVPDTDYPRTNTTEQFQEIWKKRSG